MMNPLKVTLMKDIDELFASHYEIGVEQAFSYIFKYNPNYQKAVAENRVNLYKKFNRSDIAIPYPCYFEYTVFKYDKIALKLSDYYVIHYQNAMRFSTIDMGVKNPLIDKFQYLMDWSFEAGLIDAWVNSYLISIRDFFINSGKKAIVSEIPNDTLDFSQILPICVILLIGHVLAILAFLCEIFYKDVVSEFGYYHEKLRRRKNEIVRRWRRT